MAPHLSSALHDVASSSSPIPDPGSDDATFVDPDALRVLVLEDDPVLRRSFANRLRSEGHVVDEASTLAGARAALAEAEYGCLVLDRIVPDGDALELVAEQRDQPGRAPVLVLSGLGAVDQRVKGLAVGADDYVSKPVRLKELALRVRNLAEKAESSEWGPVHLGGVVVDRERDRVTMDGAEVHLTPHQHAVLDYLVAHRERMIATEELLEHCWDGGRPLFANPLHSQVTRLRRIFAGRLRIESVRGAGYVLKVDEVAPPATPCRGRVRVTSDGRHRHTGE
ncbi:MAG TPA: response regulator transcription factor [Acidimicrobiales bacterium]|nr:response regulator transcription factor [Acidimicrobiales bacterium]